ncbi:MAG TPA: peptidoglycan-binding protein [Acidimicrobiales bacterium]|nr:peptidoglycan-binding protein [Acidimicrobiales bacterium]
MPLTNPRFAGEPVLEACLAGEHRMMAPETGPAVAKVQQALIDLGFARSLHGADGLFSDDTGAAVVSYKTDRAIFPNDPVVGPKTMARLDAEPDLLPPASPEARVVQAEALVADIEGLLRELSGVLSSLREDLR